MEFQKVNFKKENYNSNTLKYYVFSFLYQQMTFWSLKSKDNQNRLYNITNVTQFKLKIKIPIKKLKMKIEDANPIKDN